jgi:dihydropteroate synthase
LADPPKKPSLDHAQGSTVRQTLCCVDRELSLEVPQIMGVLNVTPDSFSDGGRFYRDGGLDLDRVTDSAVAMQAAGAAILDVGGESTRPGAPQVSVEEERLRVIPVIKALAGLDIILSVDTRHGEVARDAIAAGVHMVNDISAGADANLIAAVADSGVAYAIMHMQGEPQTMQRAPSYENVVEEVADYLRARWQHCVERGVRPDRLVVDPGFGFGKTLEHNLQLLAGLGSIRIDDCPVLVGLSRKSMLGKLTGRDVDERTIASVSAAVIALERGADIVRVHDVAATADALQVWQAVASIGPDGSTRKHDHG